MKTWLNTSSPARHWRVVNAKGVIECNLCPRHCRPGDGKYGFCRVRGRVGNAYATFNFGKSVLATEEVIETEAVNHYRPGARILSLGNVGCMMDCDFCQNWQTSQVRHIDPAVVKQYTPEQVVQTALHAGIQVISWTYNDPVVWHEFVVEASALAQKAGIRTVYKSAFYIERAPVEELIEVIDIFSISLKSMNEKFYQKFTRAHLQPVLDRIEQVHASGRHLEVSNLMVPGLNDSDEDVCRAIDWIGSKLGCDVPLHFVAFHPAYKYTSVARTPLTTLLRAREFARHAGLQHIYLGNVYGEGLSDTHCPGCGNTLVRRFGLHARVCGIDRSGNCTGCGVASPVREPHYDDAVAINTSDATFTGRWFPWNRESSSVHVELPDAAPDTVVRVRYGSEGPTRHFNLVGGLRRVIVSRSAAGEDRVEIAWNGPTAPRLLPVLDRAHFPV